MSLPSDALKARVLEAAKAAPSQTPAEHKREAIGLLAVAMVVGVVLAVGVGMALHWHSINVGGPGAPARSREVLAETFLGGLAIAGIALMASASRGRSMVGRARLWIVAALVLAPVALFFWKTTVGAQIPGLSTSDYGALGLKCLAISFMTGTLPFAAIIYLRRYSDPVHPWISGAGIGLSAGMLAWLVVDLWCPVCYVPHLLLGHVLPTVTFIVTGAAAGGLFLGLHHEDSPGKS